MHANEVSEKDVGLGLRHVKQKVGLAGLMPNHTDRGISASTDRGRTKPNARWELARTE